jgi:Tfp pilus assembly protein PilF
MGDNAGALKALKIAVAKDGRLGHAQVLLGMVYQMMNRNTDARAAYERYLALDPNGKHAKEVRSTLKNLPQ